MHFWNLGFSSARIFFKVLRWTPIARAAPDCWRLRDPERSKILNVPVIGISTPSSGQERSPENQGSTPRCVRMMFGRTQEILATGPKSLRSRILTQWPLGSTLVQSRHLHTTREIFFYYSAEKNTITNLDVKIEYFSGSYSYFYRFFCTLFSKTCLNKICLCWNPVLNVKNSLSLWKIYYRIITVQWKISPRRDFCFGLWRLLSHILLYKCLLQYNKTYLDGTQMTEKRLFFKHISENFSVITCQNLC